MAGATPAFAQAACDRADLQQVVENYVAAQTNGMPLTVKPADFSEYSEQGDSSASMSTGMLSTPLRPSFYRGLLDQQACTVFMELVGVTAGGPVVIGARLQYAGRYNPIAPERVNQIELIVAEPAAPPFDAATTTGLEKAEGWNEIAAGSRDSRETLSKVAATYLDHLGDPNVAVPWAASCSILAGGRYAGDGPNGCVTVMPGALKASDRRYVVDETIGAVAALFLTGDAKTPGAVVLRIEGGKIRYAHVLTACRRGRCP